MNRLSANLEHADPGPKSSLEQLGIWDRLVHTPAPRNFR